MKTYQKLIIIVIAIIALLLGCNSLKGKDDTEKTKLQKLEQVILLSI
jgi:uncharacterized lipoprotein NlpE involved in copper resistance